MDFYTVLDQVLAAAPARTGLVSGPQAPVRPGRRRACGSAGRTPLRPPPGGRRRRQGPGLDWCGWVQQCHPCRTSPPPAHRAPLRRNAGSSPCCSATWWTRPVSPGNWTQDYREVVRAYQAAAAEVVQRFDGYIAQYLGDGLLVYLAIPRRMKMTRSGLGGPAWVQGIASLNTRLTRDRGLRLAVRVGIHRCGGGGCHRRWWAAGAVGSGRHAQPGGPAARAGSA